MIKFHNTPFWILRIDRYKLITDIGQLFDSLEDGNKSEESGIFDSLSSIDEVFQFNDGVCMAFVYLVRPWNQILAVKSLGYVNKRHLMTFWRIPLVIIANIERLKQWNWQFIIFARQYPPAYEGGVYRYGKVKDYENTCYTYNQLDKLVFVYSNNFATI